MHVCIYVCIDKQSVCGISFLQKRGHRSCIYIWWKRRGEEKEEKEKEKLEEEKVKEKTRHDAWC